MTEECEHELWHADCSKPDYTIKCAKCGVEFPEEST